MRTRIKEGDMKRKNLTALLTAAALVLTAAMTVQADSGYASIYEGAFEDALDRHDSMIADGETDDPYNDLSYALADITGDGVDELVFRQRISKHLSDFWVYSYDGSEPYYMGNFGSDADWDSIYAYENGILYRESYKGSVSLFLAQWDGNAFDVLTLYEGQYDRNGDPPTVRDLQNHYDPESLLDQFPEFETIEDGSSPIDDDEEDLPVYSDDPFDLDSYGYRTVVTGDRGALVFQNAPNGDFLYDYQYWSGDRIFVNLNWRQDGYAIAYQDDIYGYVDASYIDWGSGTLTGYDDRFNLDNFAHRTVRTDNSKGALVFQNAPNGSFMNAYQFWNGDDIYVNLYWSSDGYAIAYKDGVYGYVDIDYVNWDDDSSGYDGRFELDNYRIRTVKTDNSKGALVFQTSPNGSFMNAYQFWNNDEIYVNIHWRQDGYAIAYSGGVYGYVDEDYINW